MKMKTNLVNFEYSWLLEIRVELQGQEVDGKQIQELICGVMQIVTDICVERVVVNLWIKI